MRRAYAEKAKWSDPEVPVGLLRELFAKYVPPTVFEMRKTFSHIVPLGPMNFVGTLCSILEVRCQGIPAAGGLLGLWAGWLTVCETVGSQFRCL
jgi:dynein heavy chain